jgi:hypothetical protein
LKDSLDVSVTKYEPFSAESFLVTVETEADLNRALEDEFIKYKGAKVNH